jgi:hypothetical protein
MLRRGYVPSVGDKPSVGFHSHRLEGRIPFRTPGKIDKPLRLLGLWRANRDQKSPVRRCFKSRPPFGGVRRFASGCRFFKGWLTGLLSRSPPTDTRPQARAYWASEVLSQTPRFTSIIFVSDELFSPCRNFVMFEALGVDFPLIFSSFRGVEDVIAGRPVWPRRNGPSGCSRHRRLQS